MRAKDQAVCQTCRARKLGCDGKRPSCSQCALRGRVCDWNTPTWTFVTQNESPMQKHTLLERGLRHDHGLPLCIGPRKSLIESITKAYIPQDELSYIFPASNDIPRICGAWVGVLSTLSEGPSTRYDSVLSPAVTALSSCITSKSYTQSMQDYALAVDVLRSDIQQLKTLDAEFAAAIMCLALAELMFSDSRFGLAMHVNGVAQLFQASGPDMFKSGALQSLFMGFRPLFMVQSVQSRKRTFIASKEWIDIPFSTCRPSLMQQLINLAASLPSFLEQSDQLAEAPCEADSTQLSHLWKSFSTLSSHLEAWEESLYGQSIWTQPLGSSSRPSLSSACLWFSDITMANFYTHLWAFQIICILELNHLASLAHELDLHGWELPKGSTSIQAVSRKICLSMEYLLQDDMKLFGPASTILPLQTAYKVFNADKRAYMLEIKCIEGIVNCLVEKGLRSTPFMVFT